MESVKLESSNALAFMLAGDAIFTVRSLATGSRYTFRVEKGDDERSPIWFVKLLTGPSNTSDYEYLGIIRGGVFKLTAKSKLADDTVPVIAFRWTYDRLRTGATLPNAEIWHEGRCGRCGRTLTVPESVSIGYGPECLARMAA